MTPILDRLIDDVRSAWRFRWIAMAVAATVAIAGWITVFALPDKYEANARVFVDTRTALQPVLQALSVASDDGSQLNFVRQSLLAGPQLESIAKQSGLLPDTLTDGRARERLLKELSDRVVVTVHSASDREDERSTAGTVYGIDYTDTDRARSLRVVELLLNTFVDQTLGGKREGSESAQKFLGAQIKDYESRLRAAEDRLAEFKRKNLGLMPSEQGGYFAQLQSELDEAQKSRTALSIAESRRSELSKQLHGDAAVSAATGSMVLPGTQGVSGGGDTLSRIQEAQAHLDELLLKFTDKHPDVLAAKATLEELKQRRAAEIESLRHGDASALAASGASSNPVYQSIQLELNRVDVEIAGLRGELAQHEGKAAALRQRADSAPQVEAEYQQLTRDYDVNKAQYTSLLANYEKARIGEQADDAGSVRFSIVQPPTAGVAPVFPQRGPSLAGVWVGALLAGALVAYALHRFFPVVTSVRTLTDITDLPVLGMVAPALPKADQIARRADLRRFMLALSVLVIAFVGVVVMNRIGLRINLPALQALVKS